MLADSVGVALLVVLDTLAPAERLAFVLHDMFAMPFDEIAAITGRSADGGASAGEPGAAAGARRAPDGAAATAAELAEQRAVVDAFLAALRAGDFEGLVAVLDPDVVVHVDAAAGASGAAREVHGARIWAQGAIAFSRLARFVQPALVDGAVGLVLAPGGRLSRALRFTLAGGKIAAGRRRRRPGAAAPADPGGARVLTCWQSARLGAWHQSTSWCQAPDVRDDSSVDWFSPIKT